MKVALLALCLLAGCSRPPAPTTAAAQPAPARWEYKVKTVDEDDPAAEVERELAALGAEGWELVSCSPLRSTVSPSVNHYSRCYLKRAR